MKLEELENFLKQAAENESEEVDTDVLWESIGQSIPKKKRRTPLIWWFIGCAMLIGAGGYLYYEMGPVDRSHLTTTLNYNPVQEVQLKKLKSSQLTEESDHIPIAGTAKVVTNQDEVESKVVSKNTVRTIGDVEMTAQLINEDNAHMEKSTSKLKKDIASIGNARARVSKSAETIRLVHASHPPSDAKEVVERSEKLPGVKNMSNLSLITSILRSSSHKDLDVPLLHKSVPLIYRDQRRWSLGMYGGVTIPTASLSAVPRGTDNTAMVIRQSSLQTLPSWNASLRLGYDLNDQWSLHTGFTMQNISTKSAKELYERSYVLEDGIVIEQVIGPGGTTDIFGSAEVLRETRSLRTRIARYYLLSIPIAVQLEFGDRGVRPYFELGMDYSIALNRTGLVHFSEDEEYDLGSDVADIFARRLGMAVHGIMGAKIRIQESIWLNTGVGYRQEFFSHTNMSSGMSEKYSSLQTQIGIGLKF